MRASMTCEEFKAILAAFEMADVTPLLADITAPVLIMHPRDAYFAEPETARRLAARLPDARLVNVPGRFVARAFDDPEMVAPIAEFLGVPVGSPPGPAPRQGTLVILFADIADSTGLTERLGDAAFRAQARELDAGLRAIVRAVAGRPVEGKLLGGGVLAVFTSARAAIEAALRCRDTAGAVGLALHLGLHAGDVIEEGENVYGGAVNVAARVAAHSTPGEVLVTDTVRGLARTSAEVTFAERGEHALRGVAEPQRLFAVSPR
jgi:class 3 adenylate cyclase